MAIYLELISDLILKLYVFKSYFPYDEQNGTYSSKSNEKDKELKYNFLTIHTYFNLAKFRTDYEKNIFYFCWNFARIKGIKLL
jgi:hypothetical protein